MIKIKDRTACFTGHRTIPFLQKQKLKKRTKQVLIEAIEQGYRYFGAGGALGFDTLAAQAILELKNEYPQIRLILVLPCLAAIRREAGKRPTLRNTSVL